MFYKILKILSVIIDEKAVEKMAVKYAIKVIGRAKVVVGNYVASTENTYDDEVMPVFNSLEKVLNDLLVKLG